MVDTDILEPSVFRYSSAVFFVLTCSEAGERSDRDVPPFHEVSSSVINLSIRSIGCFYYIL